MRASFCIKEMPMKSLKVLLSFILRVLCSGMGGRAGQGARGLASAARGATQSMATLSQKQCKMRSDSTLRDGYFFP